jgi:SAM-dependent methyltransferase
MNIERSCPICGEDAAESRAGIAAPPWNLASCRRCRFVYLRNPPEYETLERDFSWDKTFQEERARRATKRSRLERSFRAGLARARGLAQTVARRDKLKRLCSRYLRPGPVLDLGCSRGYNAFALPPGAIPLGIEIAPALAAEARDRLATFGGRVIQASVLKGLAGLEPSSCSGAIAKSYLEHEIRPREVLGDLARVLENGAPLILKVPNYGSWLRSARGAAWSGYRFPDHVNYFTPASLERLLEGSGFTVVRFGIGDRLPTSDNMWCVARKAN